MACAAFAAVHFLALVSYSPADLPPWVPFSAPNTVELTGQNFVGPWGAVLAGYSYFFFGAASYLIPAVVFWLGIAELCGFHLFRFSTLTAVAALMVSSASLVELQTLFLQDWVKENDMPGTRGGVSGYLFGELFVGNVLGTVGGVMLMLAIYVFSLVLITGYRFFSYAAVRQSHSEIPETLPGDPPRPRDFDENEPPRQRIQLGPYSYSDYDSSYPHATPFTQLATEQDLTGPQSLEEEGFSYEEDYEDSYEEPSSDSFGEPYADKKSMADTAPYWVDEVYEEEPDPYLDTTPVKPMPVTEPVRDAEVRKPGPSRRQRGRNLYDLPSLDLLDYAQKRQLTERDIAELRATQRVIVETLASFGVAVRPGEITRGPTVTRYEIYPGEGLRVKQIVNLEADIACATKAKAINILAPIPGKDTVGIEIANDERVLVPLRDLLEDPEFYDPDKRIPLALGQDVYGRPVIGDLASMPHLLVAGATGSGKSVCINSIIASLLYRFTPEELRLILIDPKIVEMQTFSSLPHLALPVVTDAKKAVLALRWCITEMERRYKILAGNGCRKIEEYNDQLKNGPRRATKAKLRPLPIPPSPKLSSDHFMREDADQFRGAYREDGSSAEYLPYIVIIIDELADLMQCVPADLERSIVMLCQKARAAGIHLILATQSPRVDVITGTIKANIPARVAFQVASMTDSRVILDKGGAEKLIGKGDMLYQPGDAPLPVRSQGAFLTDTEVDEIADYCSIQMEPNFEVGISEQMEGEYEEGPEVLTPEDEEILQRCIEIIASERRASTSYLQRRLRLGYTRAARMIDILEQRGVVGSADGSKPREILIDLNEDLP